MNAAPTPTPASAADKTTQFSDLDSNLDPIEGAEGIAGDGPVREAIDTSGVSRIQFPTPPMEGDPLFGQDAATDYRARWDVVQRSFVDDPKQAVRQGDELVTQVIDALRETFAAQRTEFEKNTDRDQDSTETLRLALRRYRAFFERLLTI
jgi:hypothetical protein